MNKDILKYIEDEKSFSKFKIATLERTSSVAKTRLIKKEREFISFDFETLPFKGVDECRDALNLFKISKRDFLRKYKKFEITESFQSQREFIKNKIDTLKVDTVGVIDGHKFKTLAGKKIFNHDATFRSVYQKILDLCLDFLNLMLNFSDVKERFPKNVDEIFDFIPDCTCDIKHIKSCFNILSDKDIDSIINKTEKTSLLALKIKHASNEKINIIYNRIYDSDDNRIFPTKNKFSICSIDDNYVKSISMLRSDSEKVDLSKISIAVGRSRRVMEQLSDVRIWLRLVILETEEIF